MDEYNFFLDLLNFFKDNQLFIPLVFVILFIFFFLIINVIRKKSFIKGLKSLKNIFGNRKKKAMEDLQEVIKELKDKIVSLEEKDINIEDKIAGIDIKMDTLIDSMNQISTLKLEVMKTIVGWFLTRVSCKTFRLFVDHIQSFVNDNQLQFSNCVKIIVEELKNYIEAMKEQMATQLSKSNDQILIKKFSKFIDQRFIPVYVDYIESRLLALNPKEGIVLTKRDVQQIHSFIIGFAGDILSHLHGLDVLTNGHNINNEEEEDE
jgi:uncharacterized membrane protein